MAAATNPLRRRARVLVKVCAVASALTAIVGALHMPFAAPLLRRVLPGVCPVQPGTARQVDDSYRYNLAEMQAQGSSTAPARPALAWRLGSSTKSDLASWALANHVTCESVNRTENLQRCTNVPAAAVGQAAELGPLEDISFAFRSNGTLLSVSTTRRGLSPEDASRVSTSIDRADHTTLGEPTKRGGETTADYLGRRFLSTYIAEYNFTDYRASLTATNLAPTGIMVREQYLALD